MQSSLFDDVYVLTYLFEGSTLDYYFQLFGLKSKMSSVQKSKDRYTITEYSHDADLAFRKQFRKLVHLCDKSSLNRRRMLSKTWFSNAKQNIKLSCFYRQTFLISQHPVASFRLSFLCKVSCCLHKRKKTDTHQLSLQMTDSAYRFTSQYHERGKLNTCRINNKSKCELSIR